MELYRKVICEGGGHVALFWHPKALPIDELHAEHLAGYRFEHLHFKLGQLLLLEAEGAPRLLLELLRAAWREIKRLELTHIFMLCHPDDCRRYERFTFKYLLWPVKPWALAGGNAAQAMILDVEAAPHEASPAVLRAFEGIDEEVERERAWARLARVWVSDCAPVGDQCRQGNGEA